MIEKNPMSREEKRLLEDFKILKARLHVLYHNSDTVEQQNIYGKMLDNTINTIGILNQQVPKGKIKITSQYDIKNEGIAL